MSSAAMTYGGTYPIVSSIIRVGDKVATPHYSTMLMLEIEITALCGKLTLALAVVDNNLFLECKRMN